MLVISWTTAFCVCVVCVDYKVRVDRQPPWSGHKTVILLPPHTSLHSSLIPGFPPWSLQLLGPLTSLHADCTEWHWMLFKVQTLFSIPFERRESVWLKLLRCFVGLFGPRLLAWLDDVLIRLLCSAGIQSRSHMNGLRSPREKSR